MPTFKKKMPYADALQIASDFIEELKKVGYSRIEISGSLLRKEREIGDIDLIIEAPSLDKVSTIPDVELKRGAELLTIVWRGQQINVLRTNADEWGAARFYLTGPTGSTIGYRLKAKTKGWTLNQHGLYDKNGKKLAGETEEGLFQMFDKPYKAPEKRGK